MSVPEAAFERTGSATVETTLNALPQFVPSVTSTSNITGVGFVGNGESNVDLRGLGTPRTLVLVDGMRMIPGNGEGVPDLNVIPPALIESVEIITGGASAVYGSDAISGVVNLKLKKEFEGVEISGRWGQTDRHDGEQYDLALTAGTSFAERRGRVIGFVGHSNREQIDRVARDFATVDLVYKGWLGAPEGEIGPGNDYFAAQNNFIEEGRVRGVNADETVFESLFEESYGYAVCSSPTESGECVPYQTAFGFNTDGTLFTTGNDDPGSVANFKGEIDPAFENGGRFYGYNTAPFYALQLPLERTSLFLVGSFDLNEVIDVYAQGLYTDYTANTQVSSVPLQDVTMPASNPLIPPDLKRLLDARPDPAAPVDFQKRMTEIGPRIQENQSDTYQVTVGVRGTVLGDWSFDAYAQHGESDQTMKQSGNVRRSKVEELTYAPDGGQSLCAGGFNPFGIGALSAECAAYVSVDSVATERVRQTVAEASVGGRLLTLPAGDLGSAFGVMYRDESYQFRADDLLRTFLPDGRADNAGFSASDNIDGGDHNLDLYAEALVPVLADLPGVRSLEAGFGYRHSDYAMDRRADTWKAELIYQPVERLRLRGSYQRATRVPSIDELYSPQLPSLVEIEQPDPCSVDSDERKGADSARVEALCLAQGLPAALLPDFTTDGIFVDGLSGGNPDLEPEDATTQTMGVVFRSSFDSRLWSDLQVSLDWYQIEIEDVISFVSAEEFIFNCYDPAFNPEYSASNRWCSNFGRDSDSGEIVDTIEINQNLAVLETSGIDLQLNWNVDVGGGELGVAWYVGWVDSFERQSDPDVAGEEQAGTIGGFAGAYPEWKWNFELSYAVGGLGLNGVWRYVDSMHDINFPEYETSQYDSFDLYASYAIEDGPLGGIILSAGIENLTDEDTPIFPSWSNANTDASQYDVVGRRFFVSVRYSTF